MIKRRRRLHAFNLGSSRLNIISNVSQVKKQVVSTDCIHRGEPTSGEPATRITSSSTTCAAPGHCEYHRQRDPRERL